MTRFAQYLTRGRPALQCRALQCRVATTVLAGVLGASQAQAISLRQYFGELSDRDRGVYLTGFMDLLRSDPQRETAFLDCIRREGPQRMHAALTDMVRQEPAILDFEVAPWFFYAAHRLCPQSGTLPRPAEPAPAAGSVVLPEMTAARWWEHWAVPLGVVLLAAVATALLLLQRRRSKGARS